MEVGLLKRVYPEWIAILVGYDQPLDFGVAYFKTNLCACSSTLHIDISGMSYPGLVLG